MIQQALQPHPGISYAPQAIQQHPAVPGPGNNPYARLAWLETQHQALFNDNSWLYNDNIRLNNDKAHLVQEHERLLRQTAQQQQLEEQNQKLLAENRQLVEEKNKLTHENRELLANKEDHKTCILGLNDKITALEEKAKEDELAWVTCGNCRFDRGIRFTLCSHCHLPATSSLNYGGRGTSSFKGSTTVKCHGWDPYGRTHISDSSDEEWQSSGKSYYSEDRNTRQETRLDQDLFDWLQDWCLENSDKIEQLRALERKENEPTVRNLVGNLRDIEDEIKDTYKNLAEKKKKKRHLKRKLIVLVDETPAVTTDKAILKKKLFTFCHVMSQPQQEFDNRRFPTLVDDKLLTEREVVKIYHQIMPAMRLLHRELVEKPQEQDKKFKPRKAKSTQWRILQDPVQPAGYYRRYDMVKAPNRIEETYVSSIEDTRLAATALQNLIHSWNEGWLD